MKFKMEEALLFLQNMVLDNETLIVACSGGPDSMALLYLTILLRNQKNLNIVCAHVNHNVRIESQNEALMVKKFCTDNNVIFESLVIEQYNDDNFHQDARKIRYNFFKKLYRKYQASFLLTAHHGDDLMETVLMRLTRGSTLKGYAGFKQISKQNDMSVLRPLIHLTKEEIKNWNESNNIPFAIDLSNYKDIYTRNRYRKYVLPLLKKEDSKVHHKFYQFSSSLFEIQDYIDKEITKIEKDIIKNNFIVISYFLKQDIVLQKAILQKYFEKEYNQNLYLVTNKHIKAVLELLNSKKTTGILYLPNNIVGRKEYDKFYLMLAKKQTSLEKQILNDFITLNDGHFIKRELDCFTDGNDICRLSSEEIKLPLYVRSRQNGDKMTVKNMQGHKKINDIFIEHKIPNFKRDTWPIVIDATGKIVWLPNLKKSQFDKTKEEKYDIILRYY